MRLIDADDIIYIQAIDATSDLDYVRRYNIERMPTIDAVPEKHSMWEPSITSLGTMVFYCPSCMKYSDIHWAYCPRCGAKMDGERKANA